MFTGLIEATGRLAKFEGKGSGARIFVQCPLADELEIGQSIAVDGACLTVSAAEPSGFWADVSRETLSRTTINSASLNRFVNVERAMKLTDRLDGHIVLGHVDCIGRVSEISRMTGGMAEVSFGFPPEYSRYVVEKGSIAIDGISLTVAAEGEGWVRVAVIPETWEMTALRERRIGDAVNIEFDIFAKYVYKYMEGRSRQDTAGRLEKWLERGV